MGARSGAKPVTYIAHPDGSASQVHFDENGSISGYTDELGRGTTMANDERGNPVVIRDAAGGVTRMQYNAQNQPEQITDAAGQTWQRVYGKAGHLITETDPLGHATTYALEVLERVCILSQYGHRNPGLAGRGRLPLP